MSQTTRRTVAHALTAATAVVALTSCVGGAPERSESAYCTAVGDHLAELNATSFADAVEVERMLAVWRSVGEVAPIAVEPEWRTVIAAMEAAAEVTPGDAQSVKDAADTLRRAQPSADRLIDYTFKVCGAVIGPTAPVVTTPLQVPPSGPTTPTSAP
ncbi:MAG: hypothetical protein ACO3C1_13685 [Ilumatobacteraceae bacterium]